VLCDGKPDTLCNSLLDADILGLSDDDLLGCDDTDGLKVAVFEASGLFDSDALAESLYVLVKSGDKVVLPVSVERLLNDSVTDTVLVTPVGNVVGLVVPVLAAVVLTVAVEDNDFFGVKVYVGEALCVFERIDVALIDAVRIVVPVTSALRVTDIETVLVLDCAELRLNVGLDDDVFECELLPVNVADTDADRDAHDEREYDAVEVIIADIEFAAVLVFGFDGLLDTVNELVTVADNVFAAVLVPLNVLFAVEEAVLDRLVEAVKVFVITELGETVGVILLFVRVALLVVDFVGGALEVLVDDIEAVVVDVGLAPVGVRTGEAELVRV
jgi:hypothetical protein